MSTLAKAEKAPKTPLRHGKTLGRRILENWQLYLLLIIPVAITIVYKYIPMYGIQIAFRDYKPARGFFGLAIPGAEIDEDTLRSVATATDAAYFRATDLASLESTYEKIDAMEKTEIELDSYTRHEEIFAIPALLALLLLAAEQALSTLTRLGRLP